MGLALEPALRRLRRMAAARGSSVVVNRKLMKQNEQLKVSSVGKTFDKHTRVKNNKTRDNNSSAMYYKVARARGKKQVSHFGYFQGE